MKKFLFILSPFILCARLGAFELPLMHVPQIAGAALETPPPSAPLKPARAAASFAAYPVNGVEVIVPHIDGGQNVLAVLRSGAGLEAMSEKLRSAFGGAAGAGAGASLPAELWPVSTSPSSSTWAWNWSAKLTAGSTKPVTAAKGMISLAGT